MNPKVDEFLAQQSQWQEELYLLREIVLKTSLEENFKWKQPVYSHKSKNVLNISGFKNYVSLAFFKGALLKDPYNILISPGENSQHFRQFRFTSVQEIQNLRNKISEYIYEAIEIEKSGAKIISTKETIPMPEELSQIFKTNSDFEAAFTQLTPGRQRAYLMFFNQAKQSKTKINRILKYQARILKGYGMNDCICGLSKRMPSCDGSHKSMNKV
jgi:uncharacterized protein YdeI (YjbR/CyaY-like superfamily)